MGKDCLRKQLSQFIPNLKDRVFLRGRDKTVK